VGLLRLLTRVRLLVDRRCAEQRALALLYSHLSTAQSEQYRTHRYFEVIGCDTGRRYIIWDEPSINIDQLDHSGDCVKTWCFMPKGYLAQGDVLLAQKLALECFEGEALSIAQGYPPQPHCLMNVPTRP
jgi:hypothetical protein